MGKPYSIDLSRTCGCGGLEGRDCRGIGQRPASSAFSGARLGQLGPRGIKTPADA